MGASFIIGGRQVPSKYLALATYAAVATPIFLLRMRAKAKAPDPRYTSPPVNASSAEEEAFIKEYLLEAEKDDH
ncbi:2442_t:CDS:2 [Paraglomus brasilianum]|uniref:2442_t:CDS:1 n=1 Tax=Paraglomus brasilianum TaxID=144538 RepID=A0A9N8VKY6_9GLOM|nr:2442_t:CDS:2 [Paraglomus brasilianum]